MRKQKDSAGHGTSISVLCVGFAVWLQRGKFFEHQLIWAASQIIWISWLCEMTSEACRSGGEARHPDIVCILRFAAISGFFILLDLKGTVDHPHQNRIPTQESCSHVHAMMRQSAVAYRILHSHTLIYHSISWIICPATASLEQKNHDSWCSLAHLLLHAFAFLYREQNTLSCETPTLKDLIKFVEMRDGSESNPVLVTSLCNKWWGLMNGTASMHGLKQAQVLDLTWKPSRCTLGSF